MSSKLEAVFQITGWEENPYLEFENNSKQSVAKVTQVYSGNIAGDSSLQYLMSYQSKNSAKFVGFEVFNGNINGKSGSVIFQHNGIFENGVASSTFSIVENSGKDDLIDLRGSGSFTSGQNGKADFVLELG